MVHRTQLLLDRYQYESLKSLAAYRETSLSSLVREAVADYLAAGKGGSGGRLQALRGIGRDAGSSGAAHDEILYGAARAPGPRRKRAKRA